VKRSENHWISLIIQNLPYGTANIFYVFILSLFEGEEALPFVKKIPNTSIKSSKNQKNQSPKINHCKDMSLE